MVQIYSIVRFDLSIDWGKLTIGPQVVAKPKMKNDAKLLPRISHYRASERSEKSRGENERDVAYQIIAIPE